MKLFTIINCQTIFKKNVTFILDDMTLGQKS